MEMCPRSPGSYCKASLRKHHPRWDLEKRALDNLGEKSSEERRKPAQGPRAEAALSGSRGAGGTEKGQAVQSL